MTRYLRHGLDEVLANTVRSGGIGKAAMNRREHEIVAHHTSLRRLARGLARTSARADDLVQDTYITALRKAPPDAPLQPWLKAVMRRLAWGRRRSDQRRLVREDGFAFTMPSVTLPDALHEHLFDRERLAAALAHLPEPFHSTIVQRFFKGRSCAEIARSEDIPAGTVRWRQARGLELLRDALEPRRHQRALWVFPVLGAGQQLATRIWQSVASPGSGKALWLWLALGAMIYAISGSSESRREQTADHSVGRALGRDGGEVARAQRTPGGVLALAGTADSVGTSAPVATTDLPADAIAPEVPDEVPGGGHEYPPPRVDTSLELRADNCVWDPETGWRCPPGPSSPAPLADPRCGLLHQQIARDALRPIFSARGFQAAAALANRELARRLGCPAPRTDAVGRPGASGRPGRDSPGGGRPGGDSPGDDEPACVTETRPDGTPCTTCPGERPLCAPAQCRSRAGADGVLCTICVDAHGETQTDCAPVAAALPRCFSRSQPDGGLIVLDLATETMTPTSYDALGVGLSSLGLTQNHVVACDASRAAVNVLDLETGLRTSVDLPCDSVTAIGDKVYVQLLSTRSLTEYASLHALLAKQPARALPAPYASRIGAGNGRLLAAWHSGDQVLAVDLETGASEAIPLHNYDGWIYGLFENAEVRLVTGGWVETGLNLYDTASGQPIGRMFDGVWLQGLACTGQVAGESVQARTH